MYLFLMHDGENRGEPQRSELDAIATADHGHGVTFATPSFANTGTQAVASKPNPVEDQSTS